MLKKGEERSYRKSLPRLALLIVIAGVVGILFLQLRNAPPDPVYNEKRLSAYLLGIFPFPQSSKNTNVSPQDVNRAREEAKTALRALGSQATPLLSNWVATPEPAFRKRVRVLCEKRGWICPRSFQDRRALALWALREARATGEGLLPLFRNRVEHGNADDRYTGRVLLAELLPAASPEVRAATAQACLPLVPRLLRETNEPALGLSLSLVIVRWAPRDETHARFELIHAILSSPVNAWVTYRDLNGLAAQLGAGPSFRARLLTEGSDPGEKLASAIYFSDRRQRVDEVLPILIEGLSSTNWAVQRDALTGLSEYGHNALPALPAIVNVTMDPNPEISDIASRIAESITPGNARR